MYSMSFSRLFCFLMLLFCVSGKAQSDEELNALNTYVQFLNESVHGLTVAHILFVNYNKDLNKYVDLDSHKINTHITNQELGASIFDNPDINTSDSNASAMQLVETSKRLSSALPRSTANVLNAYVSDIKIILEKINALRFEIESFLKSSDLNEKENIYTSYELLVTYKYEPLDFTFLAIHEASVSMIQNIRNEQTSQSDKYLSKILEAVDDFETKDYKLSNTQKLTGQEFSRQVREMTSFVNNQLNGGAVPENFKLYGKNYYMHNHLLLSTFNSISPGFVSKMNTILKKRSNKFLAYDDRPVIYKVTYPQKMAEIEEVVTKKANALNTAPILKMPPEITSPSQPAEPEQDYIVLEFYDPDLIDRDSISVSFNDEWILENYKLQEEPNKIRIDIDPLKGNSVFILAKNEGVISPNTVGFKYRYNGKGKKNVIRKMLEKNKGWELVLTIDGLGGFSDK